MLTQGLGSGLVPPKRSGIEGPVILGPGNNVIGSGLPRHTTGGAPCGVNDIERLVRTEKKIKASFTIVTSYQNLCRDTLEIIAICITPFTNNTIATAVT